MRPSRDFLRTTASASGSSGTLASDCSAAVISGQALVSAGFAARTSGASVPTSATNVTSRMTDGQAWRRNRAFIVPSHDAVPHSNGARRSRVVLSYARPPRRRQQIGHAAGGDVDARATGAPHPASGRSLFVALVVALVAACLWAATAGEQAAPNTPIRDDAILLEETFDIEIMSKALARLRYRNRTQVLTRLGVEQYGGAAVGYRPGVTVRDFRGAVLMPDGRRVEVKKQNVSDRAAFASFELYSDSMMRVMAFPGLVPGATIEYSYEQEF